jgi:PAS domain S-box-containing protein
MISEVLKRADIDGIVCADIDYLLSELEMGAGALIIGDEALDRAAVAKVAGALESEPQWSALPVLIMTSGGEATEASQFRLKLVQDLGNVTLLERPLRSVTFISAVETALRARRRQYEISDFLREREALLAQVQESERIYRGIGESIDYGIWICTPDGRNIYSSDSFLNLVGRTQEQCAGFGWAEVLHPEDVEATLATWKCSTETGTFWDRSHRFLGCDRKWHHVLARGVPIRNEEGEVLCWAGINLDIGREKEAERALHESNQALRRSNADLEQFAYAASHDLQEPLRNVAIFTQLLKDQYEERLDGQATEFISLVVNSAKRMQLLIKDLLAYTRATGREEEVTEYADAHSVLDKVLLDLRLQINEHHAEIVCDELPRVRMHEVHLQQLLQNLLSNAIKYRSGKRLRVHISAVRNGQWVFSVGDNGIGLDPRYAEQIFGVFKRLHNSEEYPGTGIGLAICQKIVERYGGRIWVESAVGNGATFFFTLPI